MWNIVKQKRELQLAPSVWRGLRFTKKYREKNKQILETKSFDCNINIIGAIIFRLVAVAWWNSNWRGRLCNINQIDQIVYGTMFSWPLSFAIFSSALVSLGWLHFYNISKYCWLYHAETHSIFFGKFPRIKHV